MSIEKSVLTATRDKILIKYQKRFYPRLFLINAEHVVFQPHDGLETTTITQPATTTATRTLTQTLDVGSIRSVKVSSRKNIPKAFEIFTDDRTFVLKAKDSSNAQEWIQCLSVAKAHSQAKDTNLKKLAYGGSLGRLNHHGRPPLHHSSLNANLPSLRTAV